MKRRDFLKAAAAASTFPLWGRLSAYAGEAGPSGNADRFLLLVFLQGGNDGLNTVVPAGDALYERNRTNLALAPSQVLPLGNGLGLHPSLPYLHQLWNSGQVAIVHGVSNPKPDFSHFRSTEYWNTGSPEQRWRSGWLGRYLDQTEGSRAGPIRAVGVSSELPRVLVGDTAMPLAMESLDSLVLPAKTSDASARRKALAAFTSGDSGTGMRSRVVNGQRRALTAIDPVAVAARNAGASAPPGAIVAHMFAAGVGTEIGFIRLANFDTHSDQLPAHASLLSDLDAVLKNYFSTAAGLGIADRTTVLVFSEFGRRVPQNSGQGTDHGDAGPAFVVGPRVRGGTYGNAPNLRKLRDGNLRMEVDFRSVYASLAEQVLQVPSEPLLGGSFPRIPLHR